MPLEEGMYLEAALFGLDRRLLRYGKVRGHTRVSRKAPREISGEIAQPSRVDYPVRFFVWFVPSSFGSGRVPHPLRFSKGVGLNGERIVEYRKLELLKIPTLAKPARIKKFGYRLKLRRWKSNRWFRFHIHLSLWKNHFTEKKCSGAATAQGFAIRAGSEPLQQFHHRPPFGGRRRRARSIGRRHEKHHSRSCPRLVRNSLTAKK